MQVQTKALPILSLLNGLNYHVGKRYCYPSQVKILALLQARLGLEISIATLNRHLRAIEDAGYVKRVRRIKRDAKLGTVFKSTLYMITYRGYSLLARAGIAVWSKLKALDKKLRESRGVKNLGRPSQKCDKRPVCGGLPAG